MLKLNTPTVSSRCKWDDPQCVEVEFVGDGVAVKDTKLGSDSPTLKFTREEWVAFTEGVKTGEFDLADLATI